MKGKIGILLILPLEWNYTLKPLKSRIEMPTNNDLIFIKKII